MDIKVGTVLKETYMGDSDMVTFYQVVRLSASGKTAFFVQVATDYDSSTNRKLPVVGGFTGGEERGVIRGSEGNMYVSTRHASLSVFDGVSCWGMSTM